MDILANVAEAMLDITRQEEEGSQNGAIHEGVTKVRFKIQDPRN